MQAGVPPEASRAILQTVERIRALFDRMAPEDREDAVDLIERANEGLATGRLETAREAHRELEEILFYVEGT